jgi:hypothetical protein
LEAELDLLVAVSVESVEIETSTARFGEDPDVIDSKKRKR